jgi:uncharacterized membrane protein
MFGNGRWPSSGKIFPADWTAFQQPAIIRTMIGRLDALFLATVLFVAGHFLLSSRQPRRAMTELLGTQGFRIGYSVVALAAFVWMLRAYAAAPVLVVWHPPAAFSWVPILVMPLGLLLAVCGLTTPSVTLVGGEARLSDPGTHDVAPGMLRVTRHPFLWGTALWAASHLFANGEAADMILMVGILVLSLGGMRHIDLRRETDMGAAWGPMALTTSALPFAAIATSRTTMDWKGIGWWRPALAIALYAALLHLHPMIIGVSALPA